MRPLSSLSNRIFLACTLLATIPLGAAYYFVNARVSAEAEAELLRGLAEAGRLVDQHRVTLTDTLTRLAHLIADLPKLKAAVETGDPPTVTPLAGDYLRQSNADILILTGRHGTRLAVLGEGAQSIAQDVETSPRTGEWSAFLSHPRGVLQLVSVPILLEPAEQLGRLTLGFFLDDALAQQFKDLTGSDIAFGSASAGIVASTLPTDAEPLLARLIGGRGIGALRIGGNDFVVLRRPMTSPGSEVSLTTEASAPVTLTLRSRTERLRSITAIRTGLGGALAATLLLAILVSFGVARTVTRPLTALIDAMRRIADTGDLSQRVAVRARPWDDEDARLLTATFNSLTETVARHQAEAAQRERLSSLGRLSTVVAHEIRNPLMIIKTAVASLKRPAITREALDEVIADVEGETARLNRVVSEVLDFARPIRFDFAEASVNDLCRASADAAMAGTPEPAIGLELDSSVAPILTDAECLRTALVNVLTNARHAVAARPTAGPREADAPVLLSTRLAPDGGVIISVEDRGTGIAEEDLAHVFEPYFTTRRAGTGLGLPIARNIITGMGGTISLDSRIGSGTRIEIALPRAPHRDQP